MNRLKPLLGSLGFLVLAPGSVAGLVPYALSHWHTWTFAPSLYGQIAGGLLVILVYGALIFLAFHTFILNYEEPTLRRTYPHDYQIYFANVPRWIPRLTPWTNL